MGRTRRLWHLLRGSHDGKVQVAGDATGDSGGCTPQSPAVTTTAAGPDLATGRDDKDTAKEIWLDAYKKLEEDEKTKKMVMAYETVLSNQLDDEFLSLPSPGPRCSRTPEDEISGMRRVIEVTLEKASRHSERKQGFVKAAKVMNTISSSVIKPMLQIEAVASLAFSIRAATADIDMVDGLCHVAKRMEWYMLLHTLLLERAQPTTSVHDNQHAKLRDHLRKSIQELYTSLLLYEIQCVCYCYRDSHITRTLRALVTLDDWKAELNDIKELESRVQMDMSQLEQSQTKDHLIKVAEGADEKFNGIHRMLQCLLTSHEQSFSMEETIRLKKLVGLSNTSDYNRQMRFKPIRTPGTCEWFCNHGAFKKWLASDRVDFSWYPRPLGVLYFFFKDTNEQKHLNTAICAVLHQLLLDNHALVGELQEAIVQSGEKITENSSNLCNIFSAACREFSGGIICVFDALDECDPDESPELIRRIQGMLPVGSDVKVKFLITTRGYPRLLNHFIKYESGLIHLDGDGKREKDATQREISLVLNYKLDHLFKTKNLDHQPERKAAIEQALHTDWMKLIISPPRNVNGAYATLLQNVPEDESFSVKILLHLMVAAFRPLTLREMNTALIVYDRPGADDEKSLGLQ
ncbi:hypothetical protein INS49_015116 [Diaporthe citri]|uniref:uncharacterized protein n=1 Tax=Diaporthe citri TaxID=83186 RepID=UPI001C815690|nr:uncharacterized protein INS49_015116 [Diaporthe citri]KAG6357238.1 hypothetical protein INS49_015116 [Diaporthe citri]